MISKEPLQKPVLDSLQSEQTTAAIFLVNGIKLVGQIVHQDPFTLCLRDSRGIQIVYKHSISTVSASSGEPYHSSSSGSSSERGQGHRRHSKSGGHYNNNRR